MAGLREGQGQLIFGLDIGTRSIVGTVGYLNGSQFHVLAQRTKEHETRAMLDGQIHDIGKVGETITLVKKQLEDDLNRNLTDVCIAAAGRVLRTVTTYVEEAFEAEREVTDEDVYLLSTSGVEKAYEEFQKTNDTDMKFYCVGYTPMRYYMNGYQIGNLEGHKAKVIGTDLIATFLPDDVVDGLYKAVELAGLHVANMTLEPIAAIQVAIPKKFRMLNMALVDVGAGTSDISITREGAITAYGMIPTAGDSLTDIIVQHCLVDFETAENIKRSAGKEENIVYQDIMGLPQKITSQEVMKLLDESVGKMTHMVADCIKELNGDKAVSAVFVVGGGGMIPGYTEKLAEELGILKERVAIRGEEVMQNILFEMEDARRDAMMVTPIGICLSYYEQSNNFIFVEFNGERLKLYDNGRLSVADAAIQMEFPNEDLFAKRGKPLTFTVNGRAKMVRGIQGEAAVIRVNGDVADMYAQIHSGDRIEVIASTAGEPASLELGRLPDFSEQLHIFVNGKKISLPKAAEVNGSRQNEFYEIAEGDVITIRNYYTVQEAADILDVALGGNIRVNDTPARVDTRVYENFTVSFQMDGAVSSYDELPDADPQEVEARREAQRQEAYRQEALRLEAKREETLRKMALGREASGAAFGMAVGAVPSAAGAAAPAMGAAAPAMGTVSPMAGAASLAAERTQGRPLGASMTGPGGGNRAESAAEMSAAAPQKNARPISVLVNKMPITLVGKPEYVFVDVFDYINFDLASSGGRDIVTHINGHPADYMGELQDGDIIDIYWKEKEK